MNVLITGTTGFVGKAVLKAAKADGMTTRAVVRGLNPGLALSAENDQVITVQSLEADTDWSESLIGVDAVIHCAGRVHVMKDSAIDPFVEFRRINVGGTLNLARQAAILGVKRFIFVSSIKVNGESTQNGCAFTADDFPSPKDAYGISKAEAEEGLKQISQEFGLDVVIIRPPLVYGPGVKGNFFSLLGWVKRGVPLPLGAVTQNRRSFVGLDNLVDLILTCVAHPKAANQTFLVSDGDDLSTTELLKKMGNAMNRPARLLMVPVGILVFAARLLGKGDVAQRLLSSLQVDITKTYQMLGWKPSVSVDAGLLRAVKEEI